MKGIAAYSRTRIESAPNEQLLVMLLEKAMEKETLAMEAIRAHDRVATAAALHHARAIYIELIGALDPVVAPEIAKTVGTTWKWCLHQLGVAQRTLDADLVERVWQATRVMHGAWVEALAMLETSTAEAS